MKAYNHSEVWSLWPSLDQGCKIPKIPRIGHYTQYILFCYGEEALKVKMGDRWWLLCINSQVATGRPQMPVVNIQLCTMFSGPNLRNMRYTWHDSCSIKGRGSIGTLELAFSDRDHGIHYTIIVPWAGSGTSETLNVRQSLERITWQAGDWCRVDCPCKKMTNHKQLTQQRSQPARHITSWAAVWIHMDHGVGHDVRNCKQHPAHIQHLTLAHERWRCPQPKPMAWTGNFGVPEAPWNKTKR